MIAIQDTFSGKRAGSRFVTLFRIGREFFAENTTIRVEFFDEDQRSLDHHDETMPRTEYVALGNTDEEKADAILLALGIVKVTE